MMMEIDPLGEEGDREEVIDITSASHALRQQSARERKYPDPSEPEQMQTPLEQDHSVYVDVAYGKSGNSSSSSSSSMPIHARTLRFVERNEEMEEARSDTMTIPRATKTNRILELESEWATNDIEDYSEGISDEFSRLDLSRRAPLVRRSPSQDDSSSSRKKQKKQQQPQQSQNNSNPSPSPKSSGGSNSSGSHSSNNGAQSGGGSQNKKVPDSWRAENIDKEREWTGSDKEFDQLLEELRAEEEQQRLLRQPKTREEATLVRLRVDVQSKGDMRLAKLEKCLNCMGLVRTKQQRQFHRAAILAVLPQIFGAEFASKRDKIMIKLNLKELRCEILVMTPRRYGKTTMVAMIAAALLLCVPGIRIAIFSTGKRASQALMDLIVKFVCAIPGGQERICSKNQEQLRIAAVRMERSSGGLQSEAAKNVAQRPDTSVLMCFPANENGNTHLSLYLFTWFDPNCRYRFFESMANAYKDLPTYHKAEKALSDMMKVCSRADSLFSSAGTATNTFRAVGFAALSKALSLPPMGEEFFAFRASTEKKFINAARAQLSTATAVRDTKSAKRAPFALSDGWTAELAATSQQIHQRFTGAKPSRASGRLGQPASDLSDDIAAIFGDEDEEPLNEQLRTNAETKSDDPFRLFVSGKVRYDADKHNPGSLTQFGPKVHAQHSNQPHALEFHDMRLHTIVKRMQQTIPDSDVLRSVDEFSQLFMSIATVLQPSTTPSAVKWDDFFRELMAASIEETESSSSAATTSSEASDLLNANALLGALYGATKYDPVDISSRNELTLLAVAGVVGFAVLLSSYRRSPDADESSVSFTRGLLKLLSALFPYLTADDTFFGQLSRHELPETDILNKMMFRVFLKELRLAFRVDTQERLIELLPESLRDVVNATLRAEAAALEIRNLEKTLGESKSTDREADTIRSVLQELADFTTILRYSVSLPGLSPLVRHLYAQWIPLNNSLRKLDEAGAVRRAFLRPLFELPLYSAVVRDFNSELSDVLDAPKIVDTRLLVQAEQPQAAEEEKETSEPEEEASEAGDSEVEEELEQLEEEDEGDEGDEGAAEEEGEGEDE